MRPRPTSKRATPWLPCGVWLSVLACGGADLQPVELEPSRVGMTPGQVALGHFVTTDGRHGFVLDRSRRPISLQLDGSADIVELTEQEVRRQGRLLGHRYVDPGGRTRLWIEVSGGLHFVDGARELTANPDGPAQPLGRPTLTGKTASNEPAWRALVEALRGQSIVVRYPELRVDDASRLDKVEAAIARADASAFHHYVVRDPDDFPPSLRVAGAHVEGRSFGRQRWATDETEHARHPRLAALGARLTGYSDARSQDNHIVVERLARFAPPLPSHTPGLVWSVVDTTAVFVSFDGGRYEIELRHAPERGSPLLAGTGAEADWPAPVHDPFLDFTEVTRLVKLGAVALSVQNALERTDDAWNLCAQQVWRVVGTNPDDDRALAAKTQDTCRSSLDRFETQLLDLLEARRAARLSLFAKAAARARAVGLAK